MKVVDVFPISKGFFKEKLSYFTADKDLTVGSLVSVPIKGRFVKALVSKVYDPVSLKSDLRTGDFSLKKLGKLKNKPFLLKSFIESSEDTAKFFASSLGAVVENYTSTMVLESKILKPGVKKPNNQKLKNKIREIRVLQVEDEERLSEYKSLIRERFARGLSVYLCFPTIQEGEHLFSSLDKGIQEYSFFLHSELPSRVILGTWNKALSEEHPVLIVGTSSFLSIPREDIGTFIIERESSRFYKSPSRPYLDTRVFVEFLAKRFGAELILGDRALKIETLYKVESNEYVEFGSSLKFKSLWGGSYRIVDMRKTDKKPRNKSRKFEILSPDLKNLLEGLSSNNEKIFIFSGRRGLYPLTVCGDCENIVNCNRCHAPTTLHRGDQKTFFFCHHCGEKRDSEERCKVCNSWRLETLGVGIENVEEVIRSDYPTLNVFRFDKDSVKTRGKAKTIISKFYKSPSAVLLGTEFALPYLTKDVEHSAVVSIDSLFSLPNFRINERIFSIVLLIRARTQKRMVIQTRNTEATVLAYAATGSINDFYKEELELRRLFNYPPFSTLIKISIEGRKDSIEKEINSIEEIFNDYSPETFPALAQTSKGKSVINALLRIDRTDWPSESLFEKLKALPPYFKIEVDPESIQ